MNVKSIHLRYSMYVEGVLVPISSLAITNVTNQSASLQVDVMPIKEALSFTKGMLIHLFKQVGNEEPVLKFYGMLKNKIYLKSFGKRTVRFDIATMDCRWDTMSLIEFSSRNITSARGVKCAKDALKDKKLMASMSEKDKAVTRALAAGPANKTAQLVSIGGSFIPVIPRKKSYLNNPGEGSTKFKKSVSMAEDEVKISEATSLKSMFDTAISINNGDVVKGLLYMLRYAYKRSNPYTRSEGEKVLMDKMIVELFPDTLTSENPFLKVDYVKLNLSSNEVYQSKDQAGLANNSAFHGGIITLLSSVLDNSDIAIPLRPLLNRLFGALFYKISVDPTLIEGGISFHPITYSYFPPRCNVVFPHEFDTIQANYREWEQPTRSLITYPAFSSRQPQQKYLAPAVSSSARTYLVPANNPYLSEIKTLTKAVTTVKNLDDLKDKIANETMVGRIKAITEILTDEETMVGITANIQHISNPMLASMPNSSANLLSDYLHQLARMSVRSCTVSGALLDRLIVGLPVIVLDGDFTVHGVLDSYSYSVDDSGQLATNLTVSAPKYVFHEPLPTPAMWMDLDQVAPENIGQRYKDIYGCDSIYATGMVFDTKASETEMLVMCTQKLIEDYDKAENKWDFATKYTKRKELTLTEVFEDIHKCMGLKIAGRSSTEEISAVAHWHGEIFNPYTMESRVAGSTHLEVDKQKIVEDFLNAYYNKKALIAE